jgi:hypothetical protein
VAAGSKPPRADPTKLLVAAAGAPGTRALGKWQGKASRLLGKFRYQGANDRLAPYLGDAEKLLPAMLGQVCASAGGECGPIEHLALSTAALQAAIGTFLMLEGAGHADPQSREALTLFKTGSAFADCSRQNSLAAYDLAVRVARNKPVQTGDPLAAFDVTAEEPDDE